MTKNRNSKLVTLLAVCTALVFGLTSCSGIQKESQAAAAVANSQTASVQHAHEEGTPHWSYSGETGPEHWGELNPEFEKCSKGEAQSPINIPVQQVQEDAALTEIEVHYLPTEFEVINNGHTIQANALPGTVNSITVDGKTYQLAQFHFHLPSEHKVEGQNYPMELHLVHKDSNGNLTVLGVLLSEGSELKELTELWAKIPKEVTETPVKLEGKINVSKLLPEDLDSYRYSGSLTTPPCSEPVNWIVLKQPVQVSNTQIDVFSSIFTNNARPVQPLNERKIVTEQE